MTGSGQDEQGTNAIVDKVREKQATTGRWAKRWESVRYKYGKITRNVQTMADEDVGGYKNEPEGTAEMMEGGEKLAPRHG